MCECVNACVRKSVCVCVCVCLLKVSLFPAHSVSVVVVVLLLSKKQGAVSLFLTSSSIPRLSPLASTHPPGVGPGILKDHSTHSTHTHTPQVAPVRLAACRNWSSRYLPTCLKMIMTTSLSPRPWSRTAGEERDPVWGPHGSPMQSVRAFRIDSIPSRSNRNIGAVLAADVCQK